MNAFLDTSVLVASVRESDDRHEASRRLLLKCDPQHASCGAHTLAELYATLTGMRPPNRFRPEQAILILEQVQARLQCVTLTVSEVAQVIRQTAAMNLHGATVYDALLLGCARKVSAERIYTWNQKHFRLVAPDLADRIATP